MVKRRLENKFIIATVVFILVSAMINGISFVTTECSIAKAIVLTIIEATYYPLLTFVKTRKNAEKALLILCAITFIAAIVLACIFAKIAPPKPHGDITIANITVCVAKLIFCIIVIYISDRHAK